MIARFHGITYALSRDPSRSHGRLPRCLLVCTLHLVITDPRNNIVTVSQLSPNDDGTVFWHQLMAKGPLWKLEGDYTVKANYGE